MQELTHCWLIRIDLEGSSECDTGAGAIAQAQPCFAAGRVRRGMVRSERDGTIEARAGALAIFGGQQVAAPEPPELRVARFRTDGGIQELDGAGHLAAPLIRDRPVGEVLAAA